MRFSAAFDTFSLRLLFPASALFLLGILTLVHNSHSGLIEKASAGFYAFCIAAVIALSLASYAAKPVYNVVIKHEPVRGYREMRGAVLDDLAEVTPHALIVSVWGFEEAYSNFMRPDLMMISITWPPRDPEQLAYLVEKTETVYVYAYWHLIPDESRDILNFFLAQYAPGADAREKLIRIK